MSWARDLHGNVIDLDGDGPVDEPEPEDDRYRAVVDSVRHRTECLRRPPIGDLARFLCLDATLILSDGPEPEHVADCPLCEWRYWERNIRHAT